MPQWLEENGKHTTSSDWAMLQWSEAWKTYHQFRLSSAPTVQRAWKTYHQLDLSHGPTNKKARKTYHQLRLRHAYMIKRAWKHTTSSYWAMPPTVRRAKKTNHQLRLSHSPIALLLSEGGHLSPLPVHHGALSCRSINIKLKNIFYSSDQYCSVYFDYGHKIWSLP